MAQHAQSGGAESVTVGALEVRGCNGCCKCSMAFFSGSNELLASSVLKVFNSFVSSAAPLWSFTGGLLQLLWFDFTPLKAGFDSGLVPFLRAVLVSFALQASVFQSRVPWCFRGTWTDQHCQAGCRGSTCWALEDLCWVPVREGPRSCQGWWSGRRALKPRRNGRASAAGLALNGPQWRSHLNEILMASCLGCEPAQVKELAVLPVPDVNPLFQAANRVGQHTCKEYVEKD